MAHRCLATRNGSCAAVLAAVLLMLLASVQLASAARCDKGWSLHGGRCYRVMNATGRADGFGSWQQAEQLCKSVGGSVADESDASALAFAKTIAQHTSKNSRAFLFPSANARTGSTRNCFKITRSAAVTASDCDITAAASAAICVKPVTACALGWYQLDKRCFQLTAQMLSWDEAKSACNQMGAHLIQVKDNDTQKFVQNYLPQFVQQRITHVWIGLYQGKIQDSKPLQWTMGGNVNDFYTNWNADQPNLSGSNRNAVRMIAADPKGRWEVANPVESRGFICEIPVGTAPIGPTPETKFSCPSSEWSLFRGSCYLFNEESKTWSDSRKYCQGQSADLIDIRGDSEQEFVQRSLSVANMWIGLHSKPDKWGDWYWNDDTEQATYFYWADNEPNNADNNEYCVVMWTNVDGKWNDDRCDRSHYFGCKRPAEVNGSPPTTTLAPTTTSSDMCDKGWFADPFTSTCYKMNTNPLSFTDARLQCLAEGADLVSINSLSEKTLLTANIQQQANAGSSVLGYWIGLNDLKEEGRWEWSDGSPLVFVNWQSGSPQSNSEGSTDSDRDCVQIFPKSLQWNDALCSKKFASICKKPGRGAPTTQPPAVTTISVPPGSVRGCRKGYTSYSNMCYRLYTQRVGWSDARQQCRNDGGDLVSMQDQREHDFVSEMVRKQGDPRFWTGLRNTLKGLRTMYFQWTDGSPVTFTKWNLNEPNNFQNAESCVEQYDTPYNNVWNDVGCDLPLTFVCKRREEVLPQAMPTTPLERCPSDYDDVYAGYCYKYVVGSENITWSQASVRCRQTRYANLVAITSSNVQGHVNLKLYELQASGNFWMGLYALSPNYYYWVGFGSLGSRSYTNWMSGANTKGKYGFLSPSGRSIGTWSTVPATMKFPNYICKVRQDGITTPSPGPTTYDPRNCAVGWTEIDDTCYKVMYKPYTRDRLSWEEARHQCKLLGGDLASIHSPNATVALKAIIRQSSYHYWIGLNSRAVGNKYYWSDGSSGNYFNWRDSEPNNFNGRQNCVQLDPKDMKWFVTTCATTASWICVTEKGINPGNVTTPQPTTTPPDLPGCPLYWTRFKNSCYRAISLNYDWYQSLDYCRRNKADLVSISDQDEQDFVLRLATSTSTLPFWIGLNEVGQTDGFKWTDGSPVTYVNWDNGQPNNQGGAEHCVKMRANNGLWLDDNCGFRGRVVCEMNNDTVNSTQMPPTPMPGNCPKGFFTVGDKCYKMFADDADEVSWAEANKRCRNVVPGTNRTFLASVANEFEQAALIPLLRDTDKELWIGMHSRTSSPRSFIWIDNSRVTYSNWNRGEPNGNYRDPKNCVAMLSSKYAAGKWSDLKCNMTRGYICMTYKQSSLQTTWPGPQPTKSWCDSGWIQYGSSCFKFESSAKTWQLARQQCQSQAADLASVHDVWEQNLMHSLTANKKQSETWIGLAFASNTNSFQWSDNWPVLYSDWDRLYPRSTSIYKCGVMARNGKWRNRACSTELPYLCRRSFGQPPTTPQANRGSCPGTSTVKFKQYGDMCYYISDARYYNMRLSFSAAQLECQRWGGGMVSITSQGEQDFLVKEIKQLLEGSYSRINYWLGMTKQFSGGVQWLDRSPVSYTYWSEGMPTKGSNNLNCIEMYVSTYKWGDAVCSETRAYVCKVPLRPYTGPTTPQVTSTTQQSGTSSSGGVTDQGSTSSGGSTVRSTGDNSRPRTTVQSVNPEQVAGGSNVVVVLVVVFLMLLLVVMVGASYYMKRRKMRDQAVEVGFSNANWSKESGQVGLSGTGGADVSKSSEAGIENPTFGTVKE